MKRVITAFLLLACISSFIFHNAEQENAFKQLYSLEGKWIMKVKRGFIGEEWIKVNGSYLQNKGFFIKGTDTVVTERVALKESGKDIFYTSTVEDQNNKEPISFRLTSSVNKIFIFENPAHDFPKRIVYELVSADSIHAYIDDGNAASTKRQDFYYKKVK